MIAIGVCAVALQGKAARDDPVVGRFKDCIDDFKQILPCVEELANPALKKRHWCGCHTTLSCYVPCRGAHLSLSRSITCAPPARLLTPTSSNPRPWFSHLPVACIHTL